MQVSLFEISCKKNFFTIFNFFLDVPVYHYRFAVDFCSIIELRYVLLVFWVQMTMLSKRFLVYADP